MCSQLIPQRFLQEVRALGRAGLRHGGDGAAVDRQHSRDGRAAMSMARVHVVGSDPDALSRVYEGDGRARAVCSLLLATVTALTWEYTHTQVHTCVHAQAPTQRAVQDDARKPR